MALRQVDGTMPYNRSLDGAMLVFGCERTPFGLVCGIGGAPGYITVFALLSGQFVLGLMAAAATFMVLFGGIYALRRMAKHDPMLIRTYLRNRRYRRHYSARSGAYCIR